MHVIAVVFLAAVGLISAALPVAAADYKIPVARRVAPQVETMSPECDGACGCPIVSLVRHRRLEMAYPSSFDPRLRDEPHFYYGAMKTYPRYSQLVDAAAYRTTCIR